MLNTSPPKIVEPARARGSVRGGKTSPNTDWMLSDAMNTAAPNATKKSPEAISVDL